VSNALGATVGLSSSAGNAAGQASRGARHFGSVEAPAGDGAAQPGIVAHAGGGNGIAGNAPPGGQTSQPGAAGARPYQSTQSTHGQAGYGQPATGDSAPRVAAERPEGYVVGQPTREQPVVNNLRPSGDEPMVPGQALRPGEWQPRPDPPPERPKEEDEKDSKGKTKSQSKNLAEKRGMDWGLRDAARGSVGVTRPVVVECHADRLVVISDRGAEYNKVIPLRPRMESSIDTFISAVWEHMEDWGIAGRGMYWRPVLSVYVDPQAEQRFADLSVLLEGSGLTVKRKN
jgi:hypothetical protein